MRRSSLVLLLVVEALSLFLFENMRSLFASLEANERQAITSHAELQAELHLLRAGAGLPGRDPAEIPLRSAYFDSITRLQRPESGKRLTEADGALRLEISRPSGDRGLLFVKEVDSPQLHSFQGMRKVLSLLVLVLGLALVVSGFTLVSLLRRRKPEEPAGAVAPLQDYLADLKNSQAELQEIVASERRSSCRQEELNRSILNIVPLGVIYLSAGGRVELFNPAAQKLFGRSLAAVKNLPLSQALPGHDGLAAFILGAGSRSHAEFESGQVVLAVDVVPVGTGNEGPDADAGRLALVRDVSEERLRERVRRQNENLIMLGEMAAALAHEVRNSLGVILGYTKGLGGEAEKKSKVVGEVQFMTDMMESFLRFARPVDKVARQPVEIGALLQAAAAAHGLAVDLPPGRLELASDPLLLNVIFSNLALNARQAGAARLTAAFVPGEAPALRIGDDGPGIPVANAEKIWLPFFSSRDKGTGMGLATVKKLAGALGADIRLENPGEPGASFKLTFYN